MVVDWDQLPIAPELLKTGGEILIGSTAPSCATGGGQSRPANLRPFQLHPVCGSGNGVGAALHLACFPSSEPWFCGSDLCPCRPGERSAMEQLTTFCDGALFGEPDGNFPATVGTSYLSAALSVGTLSPRQAWSAAQEASAGAQRRATSGHWRLGAGTGLAQFYQQALFHFPELADGPYREQWQRFPWRTTQNGLSAGGGKPGCPSLMRRCVSSVRAAGCTTAAA